MSIETQINELIRAIECIELTPESTVDFGVDSYNLIAGIWEELSEMNKTFKRIEEKLK